jgi:hypothetical protein
MIVDDHFESRHTQVKARFFGKAHIEHHIKLLVNVLELIFDHGASKDIVLSHHFGGLLADQPLVAFHLITHELEHLAVNLFGWDMAEEAGIVNNVERFAANDGSVYRMVLFM